MGSSVSIVVSAMLMTDVDDGAAVYDTTDLSGSILYLTLSTETRAVPSWFGSA